MFVLTFLLYGGLSEVIFLFLIVYFFLGGGLSGVYVSLSKNLVFKCSFFSFPYLYWRWFCLVSYSIVCHWCIVGFFFYHGWWVVGKGGHVKWDVFIFWLVGTFLSFNQMLHKKFVWFKLVYISMSYILFVESYLLKCFKNLFPNFICFRFVEVSLDYLSVVSLLVCIAFLLFFPIVLVWFRLGSLIYINIRALFTTEDIFVKEQEDAILYKAGENKGVHAFLNIISLKVNIIASTEFELAY